MNDPVKNKKSWLALETVIIIGLSFKLILTAAFLMFFHDSTPMSLETGVAYAQDKNAESAEQTPTGNQNQEAKPAPATQQDLSARELALRRREERLREKEKALTALEQQIKMRLGEIEATRRKLADLVKKQEKLVKKQESQKNARIEHLVTAYKGMRPEAAGTLVNSLEDDVAVEILAAMPGRAAGQILAYVDPKKAARLTKAISLKKSPVEKEQEKQAAPASRPAAPKPASPKPNDNSSLSEPGLPQMIDPQGNRPQSLRNNARVPKPKENIPSGTGFPKPPQPAELS
jgi:flagellar motility protein MotE (MotC chaperone)